MGLGKTVMTIALILARPGKGSSDCKERVNRIEDPRTNTMPKAKGGTLIICPMALLGQWKVILFPRVVRK
jgi:DNA repair protein RAD5